MCRVIYPLMMRSPGWNFKKKSIAIYLPQSEANDMIEAAIGTNEVCCADIVRPVNVSYKHMPFYTRSSPQW